VFILGENRQSHDFDEKMTIRRRAIVQFMGCQLAKVGGQSNHLLEIVDPPLKLTILSDGQFLNESLPTVSIITTSLLVITILLQPGHRTSRLPQRCMPTSLQVFVLAVRTYQPLTSVTCEPSIQHALSHQSHVTQAYSMLRHYASHNVIDTLYVMIGCSTPSDLSDHLHTGFSIFAAF